MKLAVVFPVMNQFPLAQTAIDFAIKNLSGENDVEIIIIDNGSSSAFQYVGYSEKAKIRVHHLKNNIGVYPIFWEALKLTDGDVIAYFHSDLIVSEKGWDMDLVELFERNEKLGLLGFIGSDEIDSSGGRGRGTTSNFLGGSYEHADGMGNKFQWQGSPANAHGQKNPGYTKAAVVDGCTMIFRREVLEKIKQRENFPPHHFYDRLLSSEVREEGYEMGVLGIGCDHISGQTVNQEPAYSTMAQEWSEKHGLTMEGVHNWDSVLYREAEKQWLTEYRDQKHLVPVKV
jgi:GT2 family glycosyltransferase